MEQFVEGIPENLGPVITSALNEQIKNSQELVVNALFPIIGKMIKKYIQQEMAILSETINIKCSTIHFLLKNGNESLKEVFRLHRKEMVLNDLAKPKV